MREIKFRVWDNVDFMSKAFTLRDIQEGKIQFTKECPIMQFTGLKDKNGKEIYEGDIIEKTAYNKSHHKQTRFFGQVIIYDGCVQIKFKNGNTSGWYGENDTRYYEIIGNIYENPELLQPLNQVEMNG